MTETTVLLAVQALSQLLAQASQISAGIQYVQSQGRTQFTPQEWQQFVIDPRNAADQNLANALAEQTRQ